MAWASGRQTNSWMTEEDERDQAYRTPFLVASGVLVFLACVHVVGRWRR